MPMGIATPLTRVVESATGAGAANFSSTPRFALETPVVPVAFNTGIASSKAYPAAVGDRTGENVVEAWPKGAYSKLPKPNHLFFFIGNPTLPPKRFRSYRGCEVTPCLLRSEE